MAGGRERRGSRSWWTGGCRSLGLCLGSQLLAQAAGAAPHRSEQGEVGWHEVELCPEAAGDPLLGSLPDRFVAFEWHQYEFPLPPGAVPLARSDRCLQAFRLDGPAWGLQFHAEVVRSSIDRWLDKAEEGEADRARVEEETAAHAGRLERAGPRGLPPLPRRGRGADSRLN